MQKILSNSGKRPLLGYLLTVTTYNFEITAAMLITSI
jgi:hypothetical protein